MKKIVFIIPVIFLSLSILTACGQNKSEQQHGQPFRVAFYNVENLFDTLDDPMTNDSSFLPVARIPWTSQRYELKLDRMSEVISALGGAKPVAVIGLCEIEHRSVLDDLVASPAILKFQYQIIHHESPDERGIDNALIYDAGQFRPVYDHAIPVDISAYDDHTRDILYVKGTSPKMKNDTLHIFVNHWPSRSEGKEQSEPKRMAAAKVLRHVTDSLTASVNHPLIIILGDFNDEPADKSISEYLGAMPPSGNYEPKALYNLGYPLYQKGLGTLYYKDWDLFDQVMVNGAFLGKTSGILIPKPEEVIFSPEWLLFKGNDGNFRPNRTAAKEYYGGYSDHLPVYLDLLITK